MFYIQMHTILEIISIYIICSTQKRLFNLINVIRNENVYINKWNVIKFTEYYNRIIKMLSKTSESYCQDVICRFWGTKQIHLSFQMMSKYFFYKQIGASKKKNNKIKHHNWKHAKKIYMQSIFSSPPFPIQFVYEIRILLTPTQDKHANLSSFSDVFVGKCGLFGLWLGLLCQNL